MVVRRPSPRRTAAPAPIAVVVMTALLFAACGSQIPFGTPRQSPPANPTPGPSGAATVAPSAPSTTGPSAGTSVAPSGPTTPATSDQPASTPPTTAVTYTVAATNGLQLTLPPGWVGFDSETPEAVILAASREHPQLTDTLASIGSIQLVFVAVDATATGDGQAPSMTITNAGGAIPVPSLLEQLARQTVNQIKASQPVDGDVEVRTVELAAGPAVNLRWKLTPAGDDEALGLDAYFLSLVQGTYIVTFAAPVSVVTGFEPAFEAIVGSMRDG